MTDPLIDLEKYKPIKDFSKITSKKILGSGTYSNVYPINQKFIAKVIKKKNSKTEADIHKELQKLVIDYITPGIPLFFQNYKNSIFVIERCDCTFQRFLIDSITMNTAKRTDMIKNIILQVLLVLAIVQQKYPGFRHNDLKIDNILLLKKPHDQFVQRYMGRYYKIFKKHPIVKISDFDYSNIPGKIQNSKLLKEGMKEFGAGTERSDHYDVHIFLNSLYSKKEILPISIVSWIETIIPKKYLVKDNELVKYGRLINPEKVKIKTARSLVRDDFFNRYVETTKYYDYGF